MQLNPHHFPEYRVGGLYVMHAPAAAPGADARPPLLLIHGASHGAWCWELWMRELPGHGRHSQALSRRGHAAQGHGLMLERGWSAPLSRVSDWLQRRVG